MARFKKASDIKVGVIGYGGAFNMGKKHLEEMKAAGMTPVAVAEIDKSRLKVAETDFPGIETYDSVAKMLKNSDVNLITIITPHNTHAKLALQCLKAGKSVCCEKPLAITTAECDAMIAEAKKRKLVITTYHNRHWDGCILEAVEQIKKKKVIGEVYKIQAHMGGYGKPRDWWRTSKTISGGINYDWGVHLLEYSLQIMDGKLSEVSGYIHEGYWKTAWKKDTYEDEGYVVARFNNGKWITLCNTHLDSRGHDCIIEFTGTEGSYLMNFGDYTIIKHKDGQRIETKGKNQDGKQELYYKNVADHMVKGKELIISGEWSRRPIHILDLGDQSARKGTALKAKYA
ncbi:MAG: Gfo/Idh/MocA family oxidoreductase [Planctomycetes bacterium]|nr:Gfo/Idh/MocA family oxidoreductase [Planctomycetota bacterium]